MSKVIFNKPTRPVRKVFIHCSAYPHQNLIGEDFKKAVYNWHVRDNGWSDIGYHGMIDCKGNFMLGRDYNKVPSAQSGHNSLTLAFCLDGLRKDQFNDAQFETLLKLADMIDKAYNFSLTYHGHSEVANKLCPVFDYKKVLSLNKNGERVMIKEHVVPDKQIDIQVGLDVDKAIFYDDPKIELGSRVLSMTMYGPDVKWIQKKLNLKVDGWFGRVTMGAVKAFQTKVGILNDGIVGPVTWEFLMM